MSGENPCKICQRLHPTGYCVEIEKKAAVKADGLFEILYDLEENPQVSSATRKKEEIRIQLTESMNAEKMRFLIDLKALGVEIPVEDIYELFVNAPDFASLNNVDSTSYYLVNYIKLLILKKDYVKVGEVFDTFTKMFPRRTKAMEKIFQFALEVNYPGVNTIRTFIILRGPVGLDFVQQIEEKVEHKISNEEKLQACADDFAMKTRAAKNNCGEEVAAEMGKFAKHYLPSFDSRTTHEKNAAEQKKVVAELRKIDDQARKAMLDFTGGLPAGRPRLEQIKTRLRSLAQNEGAAVVGQIDRILLRIDQTMLNTLFNRLQGLNKSLGFDTQQIVNDARKLFSDGQREEAIALVDGFINAEPAKRRDRMAEMVKTFFEDEETDLTKKENALFEKLMDFKKNPDPKIADMPKKQRADNVRLESFASFKMKFLVDLSFATNDNIDQQEIEKLFLSLSLERITDPQSIVNYLHTYVDLQMLKGDYDKAIDLCRRLISIEPENVGLLAHLYFTSLAHNLSCVDKIISVMEEFGFTQDQIEKMNKKHQRSFVARDDYSESLFNYKGEVEAFRSRVSGQLADGMDKFADNYIPDFSKIPIRKLEIKRIIKSVFRSMPWCDLYSYENSRTSLNVHKGTMVAILKENKAKKISIEDEAKILLDIYHAIITIQFDEIQKIFNNRGEIVPVEIEKRLEQLQSMVDRGLGESAVTELDSLIFKLQTAPKQPRPVVPRLKQARPAVDIEKEDKKISVDQEVMIRDFYNAMYEMDEVRARKMLDKLKRVISLKVYSELEGKFLSFSGYRYKPKGNVVWSDMADRRPVNKLAFDVTRKKK